MAGLYYFIVARQSPQVIRYWEYSPASDIPYAVDCAEPGSWVSVRTYRAGLGGQSQRDKLVRQLKEGAP